MPHQGKGARRARRRGQRLVHAVRPVRRPERRHRFPPEVGSGVWVEFEGGDVSYPIWVGCYWREGESPPNVGAHVKVVVTAAPHTLIFDDDQRSIMLSDPNGNAVTLDGTGITLSKGGQRVALSDASVSVNNGALEVQ